MALVRLTVVRNEMEADMLCGELRANGIECMHRAGGLIAGLFGSSVSGAVLGETAPTEILVDEKDLERATTLLPDG
jgi:hypothetical protein